MGNHDFNHEALCRGEATPPFTIVVGSAPEGNVLRGVITAESAKLCVAESGVPLDEEYRQTLADINSSSALPATVVNGGVASLWRRALWPK